jgi:hypothetical protein
MQSQEESDDEDGKECGEDEDEVEEEEDSPLRRVRRMVQLREMDLLADAVAEWHGVTQVAAFALPISPCVC